MYVTIVDSAKGMLEIKEIPTVVSVRKRGTTNEVFDKMHAQIMTLVYEA